MFFVLPGGSGKKDSLHHILIQSGHYDDDEDTTEELFEEVLSGYPVVKYKIRLCSLFGLFAQCR